MLGLRRVFGNVYRSRRGLSDLKVLQSPAINFSRGISTFLTGITAGTLGSLVGLGGAFITNPILSGPIGLSAHNAIGTSMAATLATATGASLSFMSKERCDDDNYDNDDNNLFKIPKKIGDINVIASLFVASSAIIFAIVGARFSKSLSDVYIRRAQGLFMICIAPVVSTRDKIKQFFSPNHSEDNVKEITVDLSYSTRLVSIGVVSGFLAGFFGVGGGAVVVPALLVVMDDFDYKSALATSMAGVICNT